MANEIEKGDFQYDVPLVFKPLKDSIDPFVPACSPLAHDPMGVSGGIVQAPVAPSALAQQALAQQAMQSITGLPPSWPSKAAQQWMASQQANIGQGTLGAASQAWQTAATYLVTIIPLEEVGREKIRQLTAQLPMRVMETIDSIKLGVDPLRFEVIYKNNHVLIIHDVDKFPAAEHVSLVLLESS